MEQNTNAQNPQRDLATSQALEQVNDLLETLSDEELEQIAGGGFSHFLREVVHHVESIGEKTAREAGKVTGQVVVASLKGLGR